VKTAIVTSNTFLDHNTGNGHPERPDRVSYVIKKLKEEKNLIWDDSKKFDEKLLNITHTAKYISDVKKIFPDNGLKFLDGDTIVSPGSKKATIDAVGSILSAIDGIENNKYKNAFCAVRPPGHHAEKSKAMGFCIYNNVAVGANYLIEKYNYNKVAIIDFDVHHGNGTQDIFYENEKVLYLSIHQWPLFPGSGKENEKGKYNNILNIPLPGGTNSREYLNAYENILQKLKKFKPEFLMFSAGFDAHKHDPLAQFQLSSKDFYEITKRTLITTRKFTNGKVVSILEGGYDLNALAESANQHVKALLEFNK
tara:strand:- start:851 stop:1777 length:927 start_codon:yes stop_codon:yes gene_type:complete